MGIEADAATLHAAEIVQRMTAARERACAAARQAQVEYKKMESAAAAKCYMDLALIASKAFDSHQALTEARANAQTAQDRTVDVEASLVQVINATRQAEIRKTEAELDRFGALIQNGGDFLVGQANRPDAERLMQLGKETTDQAQVAVIAAKVIAQRDGDCLGKTVTDAALVARGRLNIAAGSAPRISHAADNLAPGVPATCTNSDQYNADVDALRQLTGAQLTGDAQRVSTLGDSLGQAATWSSSTLDDKANPDPEVKDMILGSKTKTSLSSENVDRYKTRQVYIRPNLRNSESQIWDDLPAYKSLAEEAHAAAVEAETEATAVTVAIRAIEQEAAKVDAETASLRDRLGQIYVVAHRAAGLIPYDPGANSAAAKAALDQAQSAGEELRRLENKARSFANAMEDADRAAQGAERTVMRSERLDKSRLDAAEKDARRLARQYGIERVFEKARENLATASEIITSCEGPSPSRKARVIAALEKLDAVPEESETTRAARPTLAEAKLVRTAWQDQSDRVKEEEKKARMCHSIATMLASQAVDRRIEQLCAEGHGPQRHEGGPTRAELAERATYCIDPETHTQLDVETGEVHSADSTSSKFKTKADYVKAEALARAGRVGDDAVHVPLRSIGRDCVEGVTCTQRPEKRDTTLGPALRIPTNRTYVDDGTHPPPTREQLDRREMNAQIRAKTKPTKYEENAEAFAVLRTDTHGKVYLRTMWPQNPPP